MSPLDDYSRRPLEARLSRDSQLRRVPAAASLSVLFGGFLTQFGGFFFAFGMIFCWVFIGLADSSSLYVFSGEVVQAEGVVTACEASNARENNQQVYSVRYEFMDERRTRQTGESFFTGRQFNVGERLAIEYPRGKPAVSRVKGGRTAPFDAWVLFVVIFPLVGAVMAFFGVKRGWHNLRMLHVGKLARGRLVGKEATNTKINKQTVYKLTFEFTTESGEVARVSDSTHETWRLEDEHEEQLLYDPARPSSGALVDALPGGVKFSEQGEVIECSVTHAATRLVIPLTAVVGHGLVALFMFT